MQQDIHPSINNSIHYCNTFHTVCIYTCVCYSSLTNYYQSGICGWHFTWTLSVPVRVLSLSEQWKFARWIRTFVSAGETISRYSRIELQRSSCVLTLSPQEAVPRTHRRQERHRLLSSLSGAETAAINSPNQQCVHFCFTYSFLSLWGINKAC